MMNYRTIKFIVISFGILLPLTLTSAAAQPMNDRFATSRTGKDWAITIGVGGVLNPNYEGSDTYSVTPLPLVNVVWRDTIAFDNTGLSAYWRFDGFQVGGGMTFDLGRAQNSGLFGQNNWRLYGLGDIPGALGVRGFANYKLGPIVLGSTLTKFLAQGNSGLLVEATIGVPWRISDRFTVMGKAFATWADTTYMQTYFGITDTQSINSGYPVYNAAAGIKDVGAEIMASYRFATNWTFTVNAQVSHLVGYAANSPISVSDTAFSLITTLGYRF